MHPIFGVRSAGKSLVPMYNKQYFWVISSMIKDTVDTSEN